MNPLDFIQDWYSKHCDGDWEHGEGVRLTTIDNPGWRLTINLSNTELADKPFPPIERNITSDVDWVVASVADSKFNAAGGAKNLLEMLAIFQDWAESPAIST